MEDLKVGILDYGCGNIKSIKSALKYLGITRIILVSAEQDIENCQCLIFPGVGAFGHAMERLNVNNLIIPIKKFVSNGGYIFGICLGMQLLFDKSYEMGSHEGLGLISGTVKVLEKSTEDNYKLPNIGWYTIDIKKHKHQSNYFIKKEDCMNFYYFVHSYAAFPNNAENIIASSTYSNKKFVAVVKKNNIYGTQFHPEKSGQAGLNLLHNFLKIVKKNINFYE